MDFPIVELIDDELSRQWLLNHFHPEELKCPHSAVTCHCEAYFAEAIPVLQAGDCFVRFASSQ